MIKDSECDISDQKKVEFYSACVNAWFNTKLEYDKSVLALSTGGIGLLLGLLNAFGLSDLFSLGFYVLAIVSFVVSIVCVLAVFHFNASHVEKVIQGEESDSFVLSVLDKFAVWSFALGVFFVAFVAVSSALNLYKKEIKMSQNKSKSGLVGDSFNGMKRLDVSAKSGKSFNGVAAIQPKPESGQPNQVQAGTDSQNQSSQSASDTKK